MSPPMPALSGSVSPSIAALAIAASTAFPPSRRICSPAWAASGWLVATMPWRASTSERVCCVQSHILSPRTAVMLREGFGMAAVGVPNGVGDTSPPPLAADATAATAIVPATANAAVRPFHKRIALPPRSSCG